MSHLDTIRRAADSLKLPFVVDYSDRNWPTIRDATGKRIATACTLRCKFGQEVLSDTQHIVDIINAATELARESK